MLERELQGAHRQLQWANLTIEKREAQIRLLEERLRQQRIFKCWTASETLNNLQLELLDEEPSATGEEVAAEAQREPITPTGARAQAASGPRTFAGESAAPGEGNPLPGSDLPHCGKETALIGYDQSEQLDVEPARYFVQVILREKRACQHCEQSTVTMAPLEERIVEKGLASDHVVIDMVVSKYCDHLPLYRQAAIWSAKRDWKLGERRWTAG